jgi:hypothetical protein
MFYHCARTFELVKQQLTDDTGTMMDFHNSYTQIDVLKMTGL